MRKRKAMSRGDSDDQNPESRILDPGRGDPPSCPPPGEGWGGGCFRRDSGLGIRNSVPGCRMTIHRHFEDQLQELKGRLVAMGTAAESMIERAVKSLLERDAGRHPDVFKTEQEVNELHID